MRGYGPVRQNAQPAVSARSSAAFSSPSLSALLPTSQATRAYVSQLYGSTVQVDRADLDRSFRVPGRNAGAVSRKKARPAGTFRRPVGKTTKAPQGAFVFG